MKNCSCFSVSYGTCQTLKSTEQHLMNPTCHPSLTVISWTSFIFPTLRDGLKIDTRCRVILRNIVLTYYLRKCLLSGMAASSLLSHSACAGVMPLSQNPSHLFSTGSPASRSYYQRFIIYLFLPFHEISLETVLLSKIKIFHKYFPLS